MIEDFVNFETAKLLKEKGFDIPTEKFYNKRGSSWFCASAYDWNYAGEEYSRPTLQMAMKWLREVHNAIVNVFYDKDEEKWCAEHYRMLKDDYTLIGYHDTYEEAAESAIKYCLENLI